MCRAVRRLLDDLASDCPRHGDRSPTSGPAVVMDQLTVLVYDACEAGGASHGRPDPRLADLRRELA